MDTTVSVVGTVAVVSVGQWAQDKKIGMRYVVGTGVYALAIAVLGNGNAKLAERLALLVFVTAILVYGVGIAQGFGFIKKPEPSFGGIRKLPR